ncbi:MAG: NAD(P)-binding domain-containing protein [Flammeovirgaceae bacterium]|nr:NAD(P)-binding domain-containing protein [Flammeovirgaceae bacterium]
MFKILLTHSLPQPGIEKLQQLANLEIPYPDGMGYDAIFEVIESYDGLILTGGVKIDEKLLDKAKNLKLIANYGVGYDSINTVYAKEKGILVTNTPEPVIEPTAEIAFGLMLSLMRKITELDRKLRKTPDFRWDFMQNLGTRLFGKTIGIVGFGNIGKAVARRANAFGMKVIYYSRSKRPEEIEKEFTATFVSFDELLKTADVISLHAPHTNDTFHLIGQKELENMKNSAFLINTSRGPVVDEAALITALEGKEIAGAGLDVYEKEPKVSPKLLEMENVVLTPHIGTTTLESRTDMAISVSESILTFMDGKTPVNVVNS